MACKHDPACQRAWSHTGEHGLVTDDIHGYVVEWNTWPRLPAPVKSRKGKTTKAGWKEDADGVKKKTERERKTGAPCSEEAFRRNDDPENSHKAITLYEPHRETAKGRCLALMRANPGIWLDAKDFTMESVGGFAGTRRVRELRDAGYPIETRLRPGSTTVWQHRLVE